MSRRRTPEKQHQNGWPMPTPEPQHAPPRPARPLPAWNELGSLNTDYALGHFGPEEPERLTSPAMRGPFASGGSSYNGKSGHSGNSSASYDADAADAFWAFPEPQVMSPDSMEPGPSLMPPLEGRPSGHSEASYNWEAYNESDDDGGSLASYSTAQIDVNAFPNDDFTKQMGQLQLQQEGIERFQEGDLPDEDEEWYKLTAQVARESLDKKEVQRQSALFEIVKSEKDYVLDLQMVEQIFIVPLLTANPAIITPPEKLDQFITEVFFNIGEIEKIHEKMVASLFERQKQEHPIISSLTDIILDGALYFQEQYETYIKHYPIAEGRHREELKTNALYAQFIEKCSHDTRIRKRDLITLLYRPVTRLGRLSLMLEHILKLTPEDHPDLQNIPLIMGILAQFLKSTQPGVAAAEGKVKLRNLIESLVFEKGEMIDLDPSNETRTMVYQGNLARRDVKGWELDREGWLDITVNLLDHYLIMTRPEVRAGITKYVVTSRPIPLDFLRLDSFSLPPEQRAVDGPGDPSGQKRSILGGIGRLFKDTVPYFPFSVHHASQHSKRQYTLYTKSEAERKKWQSALEETLALRKAQQEANRLFVLETISDDFFHSPSPLVPASSPLRKEKDYFTGKMSCASRFTIGGRFYAVVGCDLGIYMCHSGQSASIRRVVVGSGAPTSMASLEAQNQIVVLQDSVLYAFDLEAMVKAMDSHTTMTIKDAKRLDKNEGAVTILRVGKLNDRVVVAYAVKTFRQQTVHVIEPVGGQVHMPASPETPTVNAARTSVTYRKYGAPFYVPREITSITLLKRTIAVAADHSLVVVDPTLSAADRRVTTVPDFSACGSSGAAALNLLKTRVQNATPLGLVWAADTERLLIYDTFGTYVSKHGYPTRNRTYVRWETKANSWALRAPYILLISNGWVEVRHISTGRLEQVEEVPDARMLQIAEPDNGSLLIATKHKDDARGVTDKLVEALETRPIGIPSSLDDTFMDPQWGEWDI